MRAMSSTLKKIGYGLFGLFGRNWTDWIQSNVSQLVQLVQFVQFFLKLAIPSFLLYYQLQRKVLLKS